MLFARFFEQATEHTPFPYQVRLAEDPDLPEVISIPTGLGKTAAVTMAWLWHRYGAGEATRKVTPRRLIYCLPTRVLVKQTAGAITNWLTKLDLPPEPSGRHLRVHRLLGGETLRTADPNSWELNPLDGAILVGTQDMLLSRALNRGYAMSRFSWPIPFALLNSDSLWVLDETQLMGPGLITSAQLAGLRRKLGTRTPAKTIWMSATMETGKLDTYDNHRDLTTFRLSHQDEQAPEVNRRSGALKTASPATGEDGAPIVLGSPTYERDLAAFLIKTHKPGTQTIVVTNTVGCCQELYRIIRKQDAPVMLIHSGYRRNERDRLEAELSSPVGEAGRIILSTQVIEAGVDISSATLVTEPAPWPSLVQRIGRCNRYGEFNDSDARVFWVTPSQKETDHLPYPHDEVKDGIKLLATLTDVSPISISRIPYESRSDDSQVLRRKDLLELYDTTPDLLGFDLDISRFIREADEPDVHVFWRDLPDRRPDEATLDAQPEELCRVSLRQFSAYLKKLDQPAYRWNHITGRWSFASSARLMPGAIYLLDTSAGGYSDQLGWTGNTKDRPTPTVGVQPADHQSADQLSGSVSKQVTLCQHAIDVSAEIDGLRELLDADDWPVLHRAALLHDAGKAHPVFREAAGATDEMPLAKSPEMKPYARRGFRHELASALMALQSDESELLSYLVAAHHGKIRMNLRSQPGETPPDDRSRRHARGIHEGDRIPALALPEGISIPEMELDLSPMEMGSMDGRTSWRHLSQSLLETYGPFKLAWLEALLRISDWRASAKEAENA